MKALSIIARWVFILSIPIMLFTASIALTVNSPWLYKYGFSKYDVSQTTGLAPEELDKAADGLIAYFNSGEADISLTVIKDGKPFELFNEREISHLKDVKGLFRRDYTILLVTFLYALAYVLFYLFWQKGRYRQKLVWPVVGGSGLTLGLMILMVVGALANFDALFWQFHVVSFANELWLLDPSRDYLIMLFPQGFWFDAALFCLLLSGGIAVTMGGVTGSIYFFMKMRMAMGEGKESTE